MHPVEALLYPVKMPNTAHQQSHNVRFGAHIGVRHNDMLRGEQYQNSNERRITAVKFFSQFKSIGYRHKKEKQCRQLVSDGIEPKQLKTGGGHPEWEMRLVEPVATAVDQVGKIIGLRDMPGYEGI